MPDGGPVDLVERLRTALLWDVLIERVEAREGE